MQVAQAAACRERQGPPYIGHRAWAWVMSLVLHAIRHGRWQYGGWVPLHSNGGVERGGTRAHPYPMGDGRWVSEQSALVAKTIIVVSKGGS